jgi:hypothetical protein
MTRSLDNVKKGYSWVEEEEVKVKVTARLWLFYFCANIGRKSAGLQGCRLSVPCLALMLDEDRDSELCGTAT